MRLIVHNLLYTVAIAGSFLASAFIPKLRQWFRGRVGLVGRIERFRTHACGAPLWIHVSSSGELEQAIPILDVLRSKDPKRSIALTYFSPSGERAVRLEKKRRAALGRSVPWDYADYSPFDWSFSARRFVRALGAQKLILLHREIWPGTIFACRQANVPVELYAAYFSKHSQRSVRTLTPWLNALSFIGTTEERSRVLLKKAVRSTLPIEVLGDPRVDRVLSRRIRSTQDFSRLDPAKWFVAASLWPEDFAAIQPALLRLCRLPDWRLLIVPHEMKPEFLADIVSWAEKNAVPLSRWSRGENGLHYLVDEIGFLAELYDRAALVFVGGSFKSKVHNVLEPAAAGCPLLTGPFIENSLEAVQLNEIGSLFPSTTPEKLDAEVARLALDPDARRACSQISLGYIKELSGAASRYASRLV